MKTTAKKKPVRVAKKKSKKDFSIVGVLNLEKNKRDHHYLSVNINNKTDSQKKVNLFSLDIPVPEGVEVICQQSSYEFILKTLHEPMLVHGMRLAAPSIWDFTELIYISLKNKYGRKASYPVLPLLHHSIFQYQNSLVDVIPNQFMIQTGSEMELSLAPKSFRNIVFLISKKFKLPTEEAALEEMYGNFTPFLLDNNTDQVQEASLFNLAIIKGEPDDEAKQKMLDLLPVKITCPYAGGYLRQLNDMLNNEEVMSSYFSRLNNLKILSDNHKNLMEVMVEEEGKEEGATQKLHALADYQSPYQYQSDVLDMRGFSYKWNPNKTLNFKLQPHSKMFVVFYEINKKFIESEADKFIAQHETKLNDFGLMLVPSDGGGKLKKLV